MKVDVGYREDERAVVRLHTQFAPNQTLTPEGARKLARELLEAADECDGANGG